MPNNVKVTGWVGWIYFAGIVMVLRGVFEGILGLFALLNNQVFVIGEEQLAVFNFTTWGWIHLILGMVILAAGFAVLNGSMWGRVVGVLLASIALVANMVFIAAHPLWAGIAIALDVVVLYALVVHGGEAKEA